MSKIFRVFDIKSNSYIVDDELFIKNNGRVFSIDPMDGDLVELFDIVIVLPRELELNFDKYYK